ncbi:MAG TPA: ABC transporter permease [candidate division Zixibacteria bacterium]|nr:ABC transporter permease [candidate division Zixibacteria bacterium]
MPPESTTPPAVGQVGQPAGGGAIYDLGYRSYDGPRLGRAAAVSTLFSSSLRAAFGWGRSGRAKIVPWGLTAFMLSPAVIAAAISALVPVGEASPFTYDNYLFGSASIYALFVAAQAPELLSADQRHRVLSLYFSHALRRSDYALAKLGALVAALFIIGVAPMLVLFLGAVLVSADVPAALGDQLENLPQVVLAPLIYALPLAALGMAIAAWTPRRAYATGAIIAVFIVTAAVAGIFGEISQGRLGEWSPLINPFVAPEGVRDLLVGDTNPEAPIARSNLPMWIFAAEWVLIVAAGAGAMLWRYRRIAA